MNTVKSWTAIATLAAVILGAFSTGAALTRVARYQKEQPMRMDQAADSNRSRVTDQERQGSDPAPARTSAFDSDNTATLDGNTDPFLSGNGDFQGSGDGGIVTGDSGFGEGGGDFAASDGGFSGDEGEGFRGEEEEEDEDEDEDDD